MRSSNVCSMQVEAEDDNREVRAIDAGHNSEYSLEAG